MSDKEEQENEVTALTSIYEDTVFTVADSHTEGQFTINSLLPEEFKVHIEGVAVGVALKAGIKPVEQDECNLLSIRFLPPIMLHFQYLENYPSVSSPLFTLSCKWLSTKQLSRLCSQLDELWEDSKGEVILFQWTQFLQDESFNFLGLVNPLQLDYSGVHSYSRSTSLEKSKTSTLTAGEIKTTDGAASPIQDGDVLSSYQQHQRACDNCVKTCDNKVVACDRHVPSSEMKRAGRQYSNEGACAPNIGDHDRRAIQDVASITNLINSIIQHDLEEKRKAFNAGFYHCQICFEEKMGTECMCFTCCDHIYCKLCMNGYFNVLITEGNVKALICPQQKCDSHASQSQIRSLVSDEMFARYDRLLLKLSLEGMDDITSCPRTLCQCPVIIEEGCTMAVCSSCHFAFCILCNMAYHGVSPCRIKKGEIMRLKDDYDNGGEERRDFLEKKYGRKVLRRMLEDSYSEIWVNKNSRKCPSCGSSIQKIDGCNKMMCTKCRVCFCWLCMKMLSKTNPYQHFQEFNSPCYNLLFQGLEQQNRNHGDDDFLDDDDDEQNYMLLDLQQLLQIL